MKTLNDQIEEMPEKVSLSVFDRIKALLTSPDEKFAALQASHEKLTAEATQFKADLAKAQADLVIAKTSLGVAVDSLTTLTTERDGLKAKLATAEAAVTEFDSKVAQKTRELAAAQGIKVEQLPAAPAGSESLDKQKARAGEEYVALIRSGKSMEAGQYWEKHKALLS